MAASLGLTLYNLGQRRDGVGPSAWPDRPVGRLVWLHAPGEGLLSPMRALARRIVEEDGLPVLLTAPNPGSRDSRRRAADASARQSGRCARLSGSLEARNRAVRRGPAPPRRHE